MHDKQRTKNTHHTLSGTRGPVPLKEVPVPGFRGILGETETVEARNRWEGATAKVKARRRAANKLAKASRKINRRAGAR